MVIDNNVKKPDLSIYSQDEQLSIGNIPSWNSPDITTTNEKPVYLLPEATILIRNLSAVTAVNALVSIYTFPFGIGTKRTLGLSQKFNLAGGQLYELSYPFSQAILKGDPRVGVYVLIEHPFDEKLINNSGAQVVDDRYTSQTGRTFDFYVPVLNNSSSAQDIQVQVYPTNILATIQPYTLSFGSFQQQIVTVNMQVPAFLTGTPAAPAYEEITIIGRLSDGSVLGGVTLCLFIDN